MLTSRQLKLTNCPWLLTNQQLLLASRPLKLTNRQLLLTSRPSFDDQPTAEVTSSVSSETRRDLFANIRYYLINSDREEEVVKLLSEYGAAQDKYLSSFITHVICDRITMATDDDETELDSDYVEATEVFELKIVRSEWVFKSIYANALLP